MKIFIETERLLLRELTPDDTEGILRLDGDPAVLKYVAQKPIDDLNQAREMIAFIRQQYVDNGIGRWAIIDKKTNDFMGWGGFKLITTLTNNKSNYYDLGYRLIQSYWGKGYATECTLACIDYGFNNLLLNEIYAMADVENTASVHVLEKSGLKKIEKFIYEAESHYWFKLTKMEWLNKY